MATDPGAAVPHLCPVCGRIDPEGAVLLSNTRFYHVECWMTLPGEQRQADAEPHTLPRGVFRKPQPRPRAR